MPLTAEGLERPTVLELIEGVKTEALATISPDLDFTPPSPHGVLLAIVAQQIGTAYEALEVALNAISRDKSELALLDEIGAITGTPRPGATYSEVNCLCVLDAGTSLLAGTHFAAVAGKPDVRATPKADFTAPTTGSHLVRFRAEQTGPIEIDTGTLSVIATAVNGWSSVSNSLSAVPGHLVFEDPEYREQQELELANSGSSTPDAEAANLRQVAGVISVKVLENVTHVTDSNGLPPHSTEALIWDAGGATDDSIAQMIWDAGKAGGIRTGGPDSGTAVDRNGDSQIVNFTRVDDREIYLAYTITPGTGYVGDAAFKTAVAARANELFGTSDDVIAAVLESIPFDSSLNLGVANRSVFALDFTTSPVATADLPIGIREIARFDSARVAVTTL